MKTKLSKTGSFFHSRILPPVLTACLLLAAGCSTKRNTFLTRNFHNLTSYYNVYWNGTQALEDADFLMKEKSVDNYFNVIPVFKYGNAEDTALISQQTARIKEKALKTIKKHSISIRGKEYVKTIDNAYLLLGKGFFYQQDYSKARSVFNFVLSEFAQNKERYEAMLWIARTYMREKEFGMASSFISQVEAQNEGSLMKETYRDLPLVQAEFCLQQEKYQEAIPYLQRGMQLCRDRDMRARLNFILGQIEQREGNNLQAYEYYKKCLNLNPPLDLVFNARLNIALCYDGSNINSKDIFKGLQRMLKDPKNQAYFGRIYYVMGEMSFRRHDEENAVRYLDQSIAASQGDPERTLMAAKKLATYFYENKKYIESHKYYTAAAQVVRDDDPDYYDIVSRAKSLSELTGHYYSLVEADTLRQVGRMNKKDQKKYAEQKAKDFQKQQEAARLAKTSGNAPSLAPRSNWYFYNEQTKTAGLAEFNRKWGRRTLEDLWFLSSKPKAAVLRSSKQMEEDEEMQAASQVLTQADPDYYLQQLPQSESEYRRLDSIIEPSLYHVGTIYSEKMGENEEGEKYLVRLINEYPGSHYIPSACETLCKIYRQSGEMGKFRKYADILAERYPGTEQNERVNNANYYKDLAANAKTVENLYTQAFDKFSRNDFNGVLNVVDQVERGYPINAYREQFLFLKIFSTAHTSGYKHMLPLAENFTGSYPESPLLPKVQAAIARAKEDMKKHILYPDSDPVAVAPEVEEKPEETAGETPEKEEPKKPKEYTKPQGVERHFALFVCSSAERDPEVMRLRLKGFNEKFYSESEMMLELIPKGDRYFVLVSDFSSAKVAQAYVKMALKNDYALGTLENKKAFVITRDNLELLRGANDETGYEKFYKENY
ncbi:MAG: tetratricopeptide repeat protein [Bacteroides sp.]|nr:tetratricopeptide repeat protein [Bacteroides sp.]MCM1169632.1 tetratricopeptide repeat protein [Bacteroides sp.]